ncbi:MAG: lysoplasmalogenase [Acidobacteriota bacterium]
MRQPSFLTALGFAAAGLFLWGIAADLYAVRLATKPWPVILMAVAVWRYGERPRASLIVLGLGLSAVGDVLLEVSDATFLPGVGAFLLAHLAYIAALVGEAKALKLARALPFAIWGVGLLWWLHDGLVAAGMLTPVAVYALVICSMMWRAAAWLGTGGRCAVTAFLGALLFATSDSLIAIDRFDGGEPLFGIRYFIIVLYWLGQAGISASALRHSAEPVDR